MFFKKQAFKLKDLLKEQGIDVPLVTMQEMLAKSYGFNNRHVALNSNDFHKTLDSIHQKKDLKTKVEKLPNTKIAHLPISLNKDNIMNYRFWWAEPGADYPTHNQDTSPGNPFEEDYFSEDLSFHILIQNGNQITHSYINYIYDKSTKSFIKQDIIKCFLINKRLTPYYKNFASMDLSVDEIKLLLESSDDWSGVIKRVLQHKDCPTDILKEYAKDKDFFVRIVAIFSKFHRDELAIMAKNDSDIRVRNVYHKYLFDQYVTYEMQLENNPKNFNEILLNKNKIKKEISLIDRKDAKNINSLIFNYGLADQISLLS